MGLLSSQTDPGPVLAHLARFRARLFQDAPKLVTEVATDLRRRIADRTPVLTGRAKASWHVVPPGVSRDVYLFRDQQGHAFNGSLEDAPENPTSGIIEALVGSSARAVPYIWRLERGWSKQAPNGMVSLSEAELLGVLDREADTLIVQTWERTRG